MSTFVLNPADVRYVTTPDGDPSDVLIPFTLWEAILQHLDDGVLKSEVRERLLRQSAEIEAGTAELVSFVDVLERLDISNRETLLD